MNIPGTRVFVSQPAGFKVASGFKGLESETSVIQVFDLDGGNIRTNAATFSRKAFEDQGATVFEYKDTTLDGYTAKYIYLQGKPKEKGYSVVFGDSTFCVMMMGSFLVGDEKTGNEIKECLLSVSYDKQMRLDPFATARFKLNDSRSQLKFSKYAGGVYMYSIDGDAGKGEADPILIVSEIPVDATMRPKDVADMMEQNSQKYGVTELEHKNFSTAKVNGYDAYESETYGMLHGGKNLFYQLVVVRGDIAIALQGITKKEFGQNLKAFQELARTVQFK